MDNRRLMLRNVDPEGITLLKGARDKLQTALRHYSGFSLEYHEIERQIQKLTELIHNIQTGRT